VRLAKRRVAQVTARGESESVAALFDDDFEDAAWAAADENALDVLLGALPQTAEMPVPLPELQAAVARIRGGVADGGWPYDYFGPAANWGAAPLPHDDLDCFMDALVSTMLPVGDVEDWEPEELAAVGSLEHADWVGSVVGVVRTGPGASMDPDAMLEYIDNCPELEGDRDPDDDIVIEHAFEVLLPLWQAIGVVDNERRVTRLGIWALPQLLIAAWSVETPDSSG
jgi:hypothetical protein